GAFSSKVSSQRTLSHSELTKLISSPKLSIDSTGSDIAEESPEMSSKTGSGRFPPISKLIKPSSSSQSINDVEPLEKEEKNTSENQVEDEPEDKKA
ncbi:MAG: hypothetical protein ACW990_14530, partial [Promethearchaeota archaeon]